MTALVIPVADIAPSSGELLDSLLGSIAHGGLIRSFKILVCFDACSPEFVHYFSGKYPFITPEINSGNRMNFAGNANRGLRVAHQMWGQDAIVVNQDCVLPNVEHMEKLKGAGIVVPEQITVMPEPPFDSDLYKIMDAFQPSGEVTFTDHLKLTGFCMYLSKEAMDKIGYFDERFKATFEDDDICARAVLAGLPVQQANLKVHHYVSRCGSYDGNRLAINLIKFRVKWSIPPTVPHEQFNTFIRDNHKWQSSMREP